MAKPIATALLGKPHLEVLSDIIAERMNALHSMASKNRMYLIETVDVRALYWLASQFDVLGYKGWFLTTDEASRRALIRMAIELHRYKGTPWAIKQAIKSLGFNNVTIIERAELIANYYNGALTHNGDATYSAAEGRWATFRVIIDASDFQSAISSEYVTAIRALIDEYKNVRSHLIDLHFKLVFDDEIAFEDDSDTSGGVDFTDELTGFTSLYSGALSYSDGLDHDGTTDGLFIVEGSGPPVGHINMTYIGTNLTFSLSGVTFTVDWGDGTVETYTNVSSTTHTYATSGTYSVSIEVQATYVLQFWADTIRAFSSDMDFSSLSFGSGSRLTDLNIDNVPSLNNLMLQGNNLPSSVLNYLVQKLDTNGVTNGYAQLQQTPTSLISGDGITAVINLLNKGWNVVFDS